MPEGDVQGEMSLYSLIRSTCRRLHIIIIIIIIIGFSVYLHNSPGDITQFNNKSMQKTEKF